VYSILNHGRVTHGSGLYKAGVGLQGYNLISDNSVSEDITFILSMRACRHNLWYDHACLLPFMLCESLAKTADSVSMVGKPVRR
jgi:hypothetical protein